MTMVSRIKKELHTFADEDCSISQNYGQKMIPKYDIFVPGFLIFREKPLQYFYGVKVAFLEMGIRTVSDYVKFYVGLNMQDSISLSSFAYNEKLVLNNKTATGKLTKELILQSLRLLDELLVKYVPLESKLLWKNMLNEWFCKFYIVVKN